jgi:hypothetical protein
MRDAPAVRGRVVTRRIMLWYASISLQYGAYTDLLSPVAKLERGAVSG